MADFPSNDTAESAPPARPGIGSLVLGVFLAKLFNSLHWALVGGLGWGFGASVANLLALPDATFWGGSVGLALAMLAVLTIRPGYQQSEFTPMYLASFGGAAAGVASLSRIGFLPPQVNLVLGGGIGFFAGLLTCVMRQYFAPLTVPRATGIAIGGTALFTGGGLLIDDPAGWAGAGGVALVAVAFLAECWRREPAMLIDDSEQPIRAVSRREMCWQVVRQSWSLTDPLAWGWHGLLGALLAALWAGWATDQADGGAVSQPFLICGALAAILIVAGRMGLLKPAKPREAQ